MKAVILAVAMTVALVVSSSAQSLRQEGRDDTPISSSLITDPFYVIYRVSGIRDNGGTGDTGTATVFSCSNFSQAEEYVRIIVRNWNSTIVGTQYLRMTNRRTQTASTHGTKGFYDDFVIGTGEVGQGLATIESTSTNVHCSVMVVDAAQPNGNGVLLHMVRFNPHQGSVE